jgi:hypothetical protein
MAADKDSVRTVTSLAPPATARPAWWTTVPSDVRTVRVRRELRPPLPSTARCTAVRSHDIAHGPRSPPLGLHPSLRPPRPRTRCGNAGSVSCSGGSGRREWSRCKGVASWWRRAADECVRPSPRLTRICRDLRGKETLAVSRWAQILLELVRGLPNSRPTSGLGIRAKLRPITGPSLTFIKPDETFRNIFVRKKIFKNIHLPTFFQNIHLPLIRWGAEQRCLDRLSYVTSVQA